jgi:Protein of unknown function (DUF3300)
MRPTRYAYGSRAGVLSASFANYFPIRGAHLRRSLLAFVAALLLPVALLAQQDSYDGQSAPNQYPPNQQSADPNYQQPGYSNPQAYNQQPDAQQAYPQEPDSAQQGYGQPQPLVAQDLEQLVAPIALYPDTLVAQILTASTYPQQVSDADRWRRSQGYAPPEQIAAGANGQLWDPSVKALTAFPQVLAQMVQNLHWTSELGDAYYNQPQDVLQAVQVMRHRAQAAGNLLSSPQESVNYDQGNIVLAPPNPEVIYVPTYNPWAVYGQPVAPYPGFSLLAAVGSFLGSSIGPGALRFGLGIGTAAFMHTPFGLLAWGLDWLAQSVLFNGSNYWSHSASVHDWGFPRGGPRAFGRGAVAGGVNRQFGRPGAYRRPGGSYNNSRSAGFARTNRNEYAGNRSGESNRGYAASAGSYGRTSREAYNSFRPAVGRSPEYRSPEYRSPEYRSQQYGSQRYGSQSYGSQSYGSQPYRSQESRTQSRPQQYARSDYGSSSFNRSGQSFNSIRGNSSRGVQRSDFGKHSSSGFMSKGFSKSSEKQARSGGFHMFGGGHSSGEHSSKSFGGGKSFSHSHSGGGHSGGHSGGKHHH